MSFALDPALAATTLPVTRLALCEVRLQDDARFPWLVLVPARDGLVELEDLPPADRARLMEEIVAAGAAVRAAGEAMGFAVEKLNVGALGNQVRQLHVHVIGRRRDDAAGLAPIWGVGRAEAYSAQRREGVLSAVRASLA